MDMLPQIGKIADAVSETIVTINMSGESEQDKCAAMFTLRASLLRITGTVLAGIHNDHLEAFVGALVLAKYEADAEAQTKSLLSRMQCVGGVQ